MTYLGFILTVLLISCNVFGQASRNQAIFENAVVAARNGDHMAALSGFRNSLTQATINGASNELLATIRFNIGVCLFQLERPNEAIPELREAIRLNRSYEKAHYSLGRAELAANNLQNAEDAFHDALQLNGSNGEAWFDLAFVQTAKKDYDSARQAFENALKFNTIDAAISHNNLGVLAAIRGEIDTAAAEFEQALDSADGKLPEAKLNLEYCRKIMLGNGELMAKLELAHR
jgi:tetratricopeptide (TPR) repeat protein